MSFHWPVVPISEAQGLDVREEDRLDGGLYRKCETYRGGGGYDRFPTLAKKRWGREHHLQFVVQLRGCHLDCPYCYVTRSGVWSKSTPTTTFEVINAFKRTKCSVFHLMGGAPALYMKYWRYLIFQIEAMENIVFHSDLLLTEFKYKVSTLFTIRSDRALYAVDVKGTTNEEHLAMTRKPFAYDLFWLNMESIEYLGIPFYITFTGLPEKSQERFWSKHREMCGDKISDARREDAFNIDLKVYDALPFVDSVTWGNKK